MTEAIQMVETWKMRSLGRGKSGRKFRKELYTAFSCRVPQLWAYLMLRGKVTAIIHPWADRETKKCPSPPALLGCRLPRRSLLLFPSMAHMEERAPCHFLVTPQQLLMCPVAPPQSLSVPAILIPHYIPHDKKENWVDTSPSCTTTSNRTENV